MSVHELGLPFADGVPESALAQLQRWATERPLQIALRHRRLGVWKAWRWIDVSREVERVAAALRQQGFEPGARLALSGAFEPSLLILALAARQLGGHSVSISREARGEVLRRQLASTRPGFAFVQGRDAVSGWLQAGLSADWPVQLFSPQAVEREIGLWRVRSLASLFTGEALEHDRQGWASIANEPVLWSDEGTEWVEGLNRLLDRWLSSGEGVAFPETSGSAARDRREIAPTALLASAERLQALAEEIEGRLAPQGSWRRRLCDWTLVEPHHGIRRWIKARVRELLGFRRLQRIESPAAESAQVHWIHEYLERAA
ncbi:AMP-binding protein [Pseudomonas sp. LRF_L74]|uniref:AMP-binding protein n=1 Tax=Pseudomonas sp. LRF_L74 TaxID=3369422 RepID=UPI003F60DE0C